MARASRSPNRYSLPPAPFPGNRYYFQQPVQQDVTSSAAYLQLQQKYSQQNKALAQTTANLQAQVKKLEFELSTCHREMRVLKSHNLQLTNTIKDKVNFMEEEMSIRIKDILSCLEKRNGDIELKQMVASSKRNIQRENSPVPTQPISQSSNVISSDYLKKINHDLRRRKSALFNFEPTVAVSNEPLVIPSDDQTLVPSAQDLSYVEEEPEPEPEPEYKDTESKLIPMKRKRESNIFNKAHTANLSRSNSSLNISTNSKPILESAIPDLGSDLHFNSKKHNPDEAAQIVIQKAPEPVAPPIEETFDDSNNNDNEVSVVKEPEIANPFLETSDDSINAHSSPIIKRSKRIPRELKNLDTEKTKKWLGMDPLDEDQQRRSRRASLMVRYEGASLRNKTHKIDVFRDSDEVNQQEDEIIEIGERANEQPIERSALTTKDSNIIAKPQKKKSPKDMSIFDLEQQDFLNIAIPLMPNEKPKKSRSRNSNSSKGRKKATTNEFVL